MKSIPLPSEVSVKPLRARGSLRYLPSILRLDPEGEPLPKLVLA